MNSCPYFVLCAPEKWRPGRQMAYQLGCKLWWPFFLFSPPHPRIVVFRLRGDGIDLAVRLYDLLFLFCPAIPQNSVKQSDRWWGKLSFTMSWPHVQIQIHHISKQWNPDGRWRVRLGCKTSCPHIHIQPLHTPEQWHSDWEMVDQKWL